MSDASASVNSLGMRKRSRFCSSSRSFWSGVPVSITRRLQRSATLQVESTFECAVFPKADGMLWEESGSDEA